MSPSEEHGLAIGQILRVQASEIRDKRHRRAEEAEQKVPVKNVFPLILSNLPCLTSIVMGWPGNGHHHAQPELLIPPSAPSPHLPRREKGASPTVFVGDAPNSRLGRSAELAQVAAGFEEDRTHADAEQAGDDQRRRGRAGVRKWVFLGGLFLGRFFFGGLFFGGLFFLGL